MKSLFLIDAYAIIYRAYYAFQQKPILSPRGENISAIFGFTKFLNDFIARETPDLLGVAFDPKGGSFRNNLYSEYKANRSATPEPIIKNTPVIKDILKAMRIPVIEVAGYEADDVIGTLSYKASLTGDYSVFMVSPDKDYGQLIRSNVTQYKPPKKGSGEIELVTQEKICATYNIPNPQLFNDILAIMGDSSDNIPGLPGVGEKGATKLVSLYGDIENIIANADKLTSKQRESIALHTPQLRLAKQLTTIALDVPVELEPELLRLQEPDARMLGALYRNLGFRFYLKALEKKFADINFSNVETVKKPKAAHGQQSLFDMDNNIIDPDDFVAEEPIERPVAKPKEAKPKQTPTNNITNNPSAGYKNINTTNHDYSIVTTTEQIEKIIARIREVGKFCFDTETTSVEPMRAVIVGISIAIDEGVAYWIPKNKEIFQLLKTVFEDASITKIGHNIKYDILILKNIGIEVRGKLLDTMIIHYLLNPESRHSMDFLARNILDYDPIPIEELIGKGSTQCTMDMVDPMAVADYACEDAAITLQLYLKLYPQLEPAGQQSMYDTIEEPLIDVLADMEWNGVKFDTEILYQASITLSAKLAQIEAKINEMAGTQNLNINSPKQLGELLYLKLKISDRPRTTKTGQFKTDEETLSELAERHEIIPQILDYRGTKKLLATYVEALPLLINPRTGRIHSSFNQAVTSTGRLSSTNPNLQNIPIRDDQGRDIRRSIVAGVEGSKIVAADYSQVELRIMAHLSGDENMIAAFKNGEDIHTATAAKIYSIPLDEVSKEQRRKAKTANFGIIYGISAFGLAARLNIPRGEAKELIDNYFIHFPKVKTYMDNVIQQARLDGYVETIFGRRRYLSDIGSSNNVVRSYAERNAVNAPIQGSAADIMKLAMIGVYKELRANNLETKVLMQVHDEIVLESPVNEVDVVRNILQKQMMGAADLLVPLDVEVGVGDNWLDAH